MQTALTPQSTPRAVPSTPQQQHRDTAGSPGGQNLAHYQIIRRNGAVVPFEPNKIAIAMMKAFLAVHGTQGAASASVRETVDTLTQGVIRAMVRSRPGGGTFHIEDVQDQVELGLMRGGHHEIARAYVLYRERRTQERSKQIEHATPATPTLHVLDNGERVELDLNQLKGLIESACENLGDSITAAPIQAETMRNLYDGVPLDEVYKASILAARTLIEKDPDYTFATARLLLHTIFKEIIGREVMPVDRATAYADYFPQFIKKGVENDLLDEKLLQYDLPRLGAALKAERDNQFDYLGLQTLYDRYFLHVRKTRIELPQAFFMRVAMGLSLNEIDREARAIEFYEVLSSFDFMSSTPTLFNAGTLRSQLSSCYLTTVPDDLDGIYESIKENALLSKFAGGLGNDWTRVRALGSHIKGTNGESQGVVPFLKVVNDTAVAVNQGGKRKGRRLHVPGELAPRHRGVPGAAQEHRRRPPAHARHEHRQLDPRPVHAPRDGKGRVDAVLALQRARPARQVRRGVRSAPTSPMKRRPGAARSSPARRLQATDMWRKMLTMLFETGHPWITFKDACNVRSPQQHAGVVHSSNLCTEITLNTSDTETAVCNLGSVNLLQHLKDGQVDQEKLKKTISGGDAHARQRDRHQLLRREEGARLQHAPPPGRPGPHGLPGRAVRAAHPVRLGRGRAVRRRVDGSHLLPRVLGVHRPGARTRQVLELQGLAVGQGHPADRLARPARKGTRRLRRGRPLDHPRLGRAAREDQGRRHAQFELRGHRADGDHLEHHRRGRLDRTLLRQPVGQVEPVGRVHRDQPLPGARPEAPGPVGRRDGHGPEALRRFAASHRPRAAGCQGALRHRVRGGDQWLVEAAARRQKWIDQAQSLNIYMAGASGKKLDDTYKLAWLRGLKTTYYLRTQSATHAEKSTVQSGRLNAVSSGNDAPSGMSALEAAAAAAQAQMSAMPATDIAFCGVDDPTCEACQ
jgi:ribonucleotide reductase alpha subunit